MRGNGVGENGGLEGGQGVWKSPKWIMKKKRKQWETIKKKKGIKVVKYKKFDCMDEKIIILSMKFNKWMKHC